MVTQAAATPSPTLASPASDSEDVFEADTSKYVLGGSLAGWAPTSPLAALAGTGKIAVFRENPL